MKAEEEKKVLDEDNDITSEEEADNELKDAERAAEAAAAALDSYLGRGSSGGSKKTRRHGSNRTIIILISAVIAVAVLIVVIILLSKQPGQQGSDTDIYGEARTVSTVDEAGLHNLIVPTDAAGDPQQNGSGVLLEYVPTQIERISVKNKNCSFTLIPNNKKGEATVYTLEGYESFVLRTGVPDEVANDACAMSFSTVAGAVTNIADFGLDKPRATVDVAYNDGTFARIRIGNNAPSSAGVYVAFGDRDTVYLVTEDAVDSFFYTPVDFMSLVITDTPENSSNARLKKLTISGSHNPREITMEPNYDYAVNYSYRVTSPRVMYANAVISTDIAASIRDLYAEEVVAVNSEGKSTAAFLAPYGLGLGSYAEIVAEYPDTVIRLKVSEPDDKGNVYLVNASDNTAPEQVVYKIQIGALSWATATLEDLYPDTILDVNRTAVSNITMKADGKTCSIDVKTKTEKVKSPEGVVSEMSVAEAYYKDELLDESSFNILFQNLSEQPNTGDTPSSTGHPLIEIIYTYSTGRQPDSIVIYNSDTKLSPVKINGVKVGSTTKSYALDLIENMEDIAAGLTPDDNTDEEYDSQE